jgi:ubiquinone/menaquinone biosynthesis C-methylase UbiE
MTEPEHVSSTRMVYDASAALYADAVGTTVSDAFERPLDLAVLRAFADDLTEHRGRILDVGCGVGRVTAYLHDRGLDVGGVDLSQAMIAAARAAHPHLSFDVAAMTALPVDDQSLAGVVLWYSIIHTPPAALADVWDEVARVLVPHGHALIGFQSGANEIVQRENAYGSGTTITWYRHDVDEVARGLEQAGLTVQARIWRVAELPHETTPQAFVVCRPRAMS